MAAIGNTNPTLVDVAKRTAPDGSIDSIVEALSEHNPMLDDITWVEGNLTTGHRTTSRTSLPSPTWRRLNEGVAPSKSTTAQFDETTGMMETLSKVDVDLASLNGNAAAFRASEDSAQVQAFNQELATGLFYHSTSVSPEKFHGLSSRFASTTGTAGAQIVSGGGSGSDNCSIWLIGWSPKTVYGIFPKGSKAGLVKEDLGRLLTQDANGNEYLAYVTRFQWKVGLCVEDYRYIVRIANIDRSALTNDFSAGADLAMLMMDGISAMYELNTVRPVFYMPRSISRFLNKQLVARQANWLEMIEKGSRGRIPHFQGIPIVTSDALTEAEATVS